MTTQKTIGISRFFHKIISRIHWKELIILISIFGGSLMIRWIGLKHGFPLLTQADEDWIMDPLVRMTTDKTLFSGNFNRPGMILYKILLIYLNMISRLSYGKNLAEAFDNHYLNFYFFARILISVLGSLIPVIAYKIGKLFKQSYAIPAALVFTFFPSYVMHSLYITNDISLTLFSLLVIYFSLRYLILADKKSIYIAVVFAALATAEKYPGIISFGIILSVILIEGLKKSDQSIKTRIIQSFVPIIRTLIVFLIALLIVAPRLFFQFPEVMNSLSFESRSTHLGADNLGWMGNLTYYLNAFGDWTNLLTLLWIALGVFTLIKEKEKAGWILIYGAIYCVLLSTLPLHWERWALPMYITPLFLNAVGIAFLWQKTKKIRIINAFTGTLIIGFLLYQFIFTLQIPIRMSFLDTRVKALDYSNENGITINNTYYEGYTPYLPQKPATIFDIDLTEQTERNFLILSSKMFDRYYNEPERYQNQIAFYNSVRLNQTSLIKFLPEPEPDTVMDRLDDIVYYFNRNFDLTREERLRGPVIEIYQITN